MTEPICHVCNDTHRMEIEGREVMCTHCPIPCEKCRVGGNGAFCETTPCECGCHTKPPTRPVTLANQAGDFDPDAPDPGDTAALMRLRACIDEDGVWATRQHKEEGDYEGCVRFMAEEIRRLQNCAEQAERSRYSSTTMAAQAHFTAKHLAELREMLEELKRQGR